MIKVEAIKKVLQENGGIANWNIIYNEIEKFYPKIKQSRQWKAGIRGVLYRAIEEKRGIKKIDEGLFAISEFEEKLLLDENIEMTETITWSKMRKNQGKFRKSLFKSLKKQCPISQIDDPRLLVASHIKPWAFSTHQERLDINNGLILSPLYDSLFDQGLITFSCDKEILISSSISKMNIKRLAIKHQQIVDLIPIRGREYYLKYHQNKIFMK